MISVQLFIKDIQDLQNVIIQSSDGVQYVVIKADEYSETLREIARLRKEAKPIPIRQAQLLKEYKGSITHSKLTRWVDEGMPVIHDAGSVYYDPLEIRKHLKDKEI